jgi:phosphoribosylglycinamide formyltransferase-1
MNGIVLISGSGSNLQSLINNSSVIDLNIDCVISNVPNAFGLDRAKKAGIITHTLDNTNFSSRHEYDIALSEVIDKYNPDVIILAGFMRILTAEFTNKYLGKILNIHPSLLPKFQGLNTHKRVIEAQEKRHGVSVHFVTEELDGGPIIAQRSIDVLPLDDADSIAKRVLIEEHKIYPEVVHLYTQGRLKLDNNVALLDNIKI